MDKDSSVEVGNEVGVRVDKVGVRDGGDLGFGKNSDDFIAGESRIIESRHPVEIEEDDTVLIFRPSWPEEREKGFVRV